MYTPSYIYVYRIPSTSRVPYMYYPPTPAHSLSYLHQHPFKYEIGARRLPFISSFLVVVRFSLRLILFGQTSGRLHNNRRVPCLYHAMRFVHCQHLYIHIYAAKLALHKVRVMMAFQMHVCETRYVYCQHFICTDVWIYIDIRRGTCIISISSDFARHYTIVYHSETRIRMKLCFIKRTYNEIRISI